MRCTPTPAIRSLPTCDVAGVSQYLEGEVPWHVDRVAACGHNSAAMESRVWEDG